MKPSGTFHNTEGSTKDECPADVAWWFMLPLYSCVNTHNPSGAINRQQRAVLENGCPHNRPNHTRDAVLSRNNGAVAEDATGIRNHGAGGGEERRPGGHRHLADENISKLDFTGLGQVVDDRRSTTNSAG